MFVVPFGARCIMRAALRAVALAWGGVLADLDARNGFRDTTFGTPPAAYPGMVFARQDGPLAIYVRPGDELRMGMAIPLTYIVYGFYQSQLATVMIGAKGEVDAYAIISVLQEAYGPAVPDRRRSDEIYAFWFGKQVRLSWRYTVASQDVQISFSSQSVAAQIKRALGNGL